MKADRSNDDDNGNIYDDKTGAMMTKEMMVMMTEMMNTIVMIT